MMSIASLGTGAGAADYCLGSAREDYYLDGGDPPGFWVGKGCNALGVEGRVEATAFKRLLLGDHPATGEALTGASPATHRAGWDCTFSAPKSVSVLWALADAQTQTAIQEAHRAAVQASMRYLEEHAAITRRGHGGKEWEKLPGLAAATFQHFTSRAGDPQLHTHCIVLNVARREDGTHGTLESKPLYDHKMAAGAIYRMTLGTAIARLGFDLDRTKNGFEVRGVNRDLCRVFSKRREAIVATLAEHNVSGPAASQLAALATREAKVESNLAERFQTWKTEAAAVKEALATMPSVNSAAARPRPEVVIDQKAILDALTQQRSTFGLKDLTRAVAERHVGEIEYEALQEHVAKMVEQGSVLALPRPGSREVIYTTKEILAVESDTLEKAVLLSKTRRRLFGEADVVTVQSRVEAKLGFPLSAEQHGALLHVTCQTGQIALVEGLAGTGKTQMLLVARQVFESAGLRVHGCSLSGKAAQNLEEGSGIRSQTLHRLLAGLDRGELTLTAQDVIVLDEAAMVGSRQMHKLLSHVVRCGAKITMIGDSKQLQPIDAGQMFGTLTRTLGMASLTEIRRQKEAWAREAVADVVKGDAGRALDAFRERGLLMQSATSEAATQTLTEHWIADTLPLHRKLVVAGTRLEAYRLNQAIRGQLVQGGTVASTGIEVTTETGGERTFAVGDRVVFLRNNLGLGVRNGTLGNVTKTSDGERPTLTVRLDDGKTIAVPLTEYRHIDHGYALTVHKSQGTTIDGNVYVLASESMTDREWGYVAISRAKGTTRLYTGIPDGKALEKAMKRSHRKDTAIEHLPERQLGA